MKNTLICILSSEKTWENFSKYNFNKKLSEVRDNIDLAIVLNGYCNDAISYYKQFVPDYFYLRENEGFDPAALAHFILLTPIYETTIILHDDHWFVDENWKGTIEELIKTDSNTEIWGNIFFEDTPHNFTDYCNRNNLEMLIGNYSSNFLHGLSGIFSSTAIKKLKQIELSFPQTKEKTEASLGEYAFSQILNYLNINFSQIPGGIFKFLLHSSSNERDHLFWTANSYMYKKDFRNSLVYYQKYLQYCKKTNFERDLLVAYYNVSYAISGMA